MWHRIAALVLAPVLVCGCASEPTAPPVQIASVPACAGSQETGCDNGKPLCAEDEKDACLMCRCTRYPVLNSDVADVGFLARTPPVPAFH